MSKQRCIEQIIEIGKMAFTKGLTSGWGGNISCRLNENEILITAHQTSLGFITEDDLLLIDNTGSLIEPNSKRTSTESDMHLALYNTESYKAVVHLHPTTLLSLLNCNRELESSTYESSLILGKPPVLAQKSPTVTDIPALLNAFQTSSIVFLEKHGLVAAGETLIEAYSLADTAESAAKITLNSVLLGHQNTKRVEEAPEKPSESYEVFTDAHIEKLQTLINNDPEALSLGEASDLTTRYAIKLTDDGTIYNMHFNKGVLTKITNDDDADFINMGKREIWIHVFNGRLDPFAATSQKKLKLIKGHIGDLSKWYAPFYRIFELWKAAPVKELDRV
ncbi:MAG: class II aldolase/adducin family protein [Fibrobacterales bacterium]